MKCEGHTSTSKTTRYALLLILVVLSGLILGPRKAAAEAQPVRSPSTTVTINFGETVSGSISSPAEVDSFTFTGQQGDRIIIGVSKTSSELWPTMRLYDPGSNLLTSEGHPTHSEIITTLPATGTYTILVSDGFDGTLTGSYNLHLQRLEEPVNADPVTFGETASGTISKAAEMDAFTFSAADEDIILIGISKTSGDVWPEIRLYDSHGNLVQTEGNPTHAEMTVMISTAKQVFLPLIIKPLVNAASRTDLGLENIASPKQTEGKFTILVSDGFNGTFTGSYNLFLQRLNDPTGAIPVSFGETKPGSISLAAEMDLFTFTANQDDSLIIGISKTSGDVWPEIRLYDPDLNLLQTQSNPTHAEINMTLPASGNYTILVSDGFNGTFTGSYNLFLQRLNDPTGAVLITFGETKSGAVSLAAEMDVFTFTANEDDSLIIGVSKTSGDIWPEIRLYDPDLNLLQTQSNPTHAEINITLPASGVYTILVSDGFNGTFTGGYELSVQAVLP